MGRPVQQINQVTPMPRSFNQKKKLLYIAQALQRQTDEEHGICMEQLLDMLSDNGIEAERRGIYDDLHTLEDFGMDIISERVGHKTYYKLASRTFEMAELKLLADAVLASRFITEKKSRELLSKLQTLASDHQNSQLRRTLNITRRAKTLNEGILRNIDTLYTAILQNVQVTFYYFDYGPDKKRHYHRNREQYCVSPYQLWWDDEKYYLIAYNSARDAMRHYRVDKMEKLSLTQQPRAGRSAFAQAKKRGISPGVFGMYAGTPQTVTLAFSNRLAGVVIDRFGSDVFMVPGENGMFQITTQIQVSGNFFGWLCNFGTDVKIISPQSTAQQYREYLQRIINASGV